jgi:hypothetical protein
MKEQLNQNLLHMGNYTIKLIVISISKFLFSDGLYYLLFYLLKQPFGYKNIIYSFAALPHQAYQ